MKETAKYWCRIGSIFDYSIVMKESGLMSLLQNSRTLHSYVRLCVINDYCPNLWVAVPTVNEPCTH